MAAPKSLASGGFHPPNTTKSSTSSSSTVNATNAAPISSSSPTNANNAAHQQPPTPTATAFTATLNDNSVTRNARWHRKWKSMAARGLDVFITAHPATFLRRLRKGCPQEFRWQSWVCLFRWRLLQERRARGVVPGGGDFGPAVSGSRGSTASPSISDILGTLSHRRCIDFRLPPPLPLSAMAKGGSLPPLCSISSAEYEELGSRESNFYSVLAIDAPRTFPEVPQFKTERVKQQLRRLLNAFANYRQDLGYCQGMNFVLGLLLLCSDFRELEAFGAATVLFDVYGARGLFFQGFPLTIAYIRVFDDVVEHELPELTAHFREQGITSELYLLPWVMTLFARALPLRTVVIVWDFMFAEGLHVAVPLVVSILRVLERYLINMSLEPALDFLKSMRRSGECDSSEIGWMLVRHAGKQQLPPQLLQKLLAINVDALLSSETAATATTPTSALLATGQSGGSSSRKRSHRHSAAATPRGGPGTVLQDR